MANLGLAYPNRAIGATVTGGSWSSLLPAANAASRELARVARSSTAAHADTKVQLDLGAARVLRAFALCNHNLSASAQWRVLLGTTSGASDVYAGSLTNVWQATAVEATFAALGVDDGQYLRSDFAAVMVLPQSYTARHLTVEIQDAANANGYVQLGMVFAAGLFTPATNAKYGWQDGWDDLSSSASSESGAPWDTPRRRRRTTRFIVDHLTLAAGDTLHEMDRVLGTVDDVLYVPDIANPAAQQRYGFVGRLSSLSPLDYPFFASRAKGFALTERAG